MLNNENFTFVKYGDGEILCMIGGKGKNCDHHPYSEKLRKELEKYGFGGGNNSKNSAKKKKGKKK